MTRPRVPTGSRVLIGSLVVVALVLVVVLGVVLARPDQPGSNPPSAPTPTAPSFNESAGDAAEDHATDPAGDAAAQEAVWRPVVENFGRNFTNPTGGGTQWRNRLVGGPSRSYVTAEMYTQLGTVQIANLPTGRYRGYRVVTATAYDLTVKVSYREGWALVLSLITDGTNWQIYTYDKANQ